MNFNEKLQQLRRSNGITQEELAEQLNVTRQTISKWERGESEPDFTYLIKISELFDVSTDYLLKDVADNEKATAVEEAAAPTPTRAKFNETSLLGVCLFMLGMVVVIIFLVLSMVNPWECLKNERIYSGLLGYLLAHNMLPVFILSCFTAIGGLYMLLLPILPERLKIKIKRNK